jgi:Spo0E like sporulation regulatory protein
VSNLKELEKLRKELEELINSKGIGDDEVLEVSQKLDYFIVKCYSE